MPRCPECGAELIGVGFPKDFFQEYRCPNGCSFKTPLTWKIRDTVLAILIASIFLILAVLVGFVNFFARLLKRK